jgi:aerobic-type carbon monoxide dehydrogenase small subunit (CoxS/CutS family)
VHGHSEMRGDGPNCEVTLARTHAIEVTVNGKRFDANVEPRTHLADFLRHQLFLTGTHIGCEHGVCGACTVLVDGSSVRACLMLAVQANGHRIETVEGLAQGGELSELQRALAEHHGLQCGYCTPGILMTLQELLRETKHDLSEAEVRRALSGNLCRCTGYQGIVDAALALIRNKVQFRK